MGVYGLLTQKRNPKGLEWVNRYYVNAVDHEQALTWGVELSNLEKMIHGETVQFYNVHVWLPNVTPNQKWNQPLLLNGDIAAEDPMKAEIVSRFYFAVDGSQNPHYKDYRVQVDLLALQGYGWHVGYAGALTAFRLAMIDSTVAFCTRQGNEILPSNEDTEYNFRQLSKKWYNRAS